MAQTAVLFLVFNIFSIDAVSIPATTIISCLVLTHR